MDKLTTDTLKWEESIFGFGKNEIAIIPIKLKGQEWIIERYSDSPAYWLIYMGDLPSDPFVRLHLYRSLEELVACYNEALAGHRRL